MPDLARFQPTDRPPPVVTLDVTHLGVGGQTKIQMWRLLIGEHVVIRRALTARWATLTRNHNRMIEFEGGSLSHTHETTGVYPIPAPAAPIVVDGGSAAMHNRPCAQRSVSRSLGSDVRIDPGTPRDARQLLVRRLERQVVFIRAEFDLGNRNE